MNIIVVGAGIAGSWLTRLARDAGHKVTLISSGTPASVAATAVLRRGYHAKDPDDLRSWNRSMELYRHYGFDLVHGATVTNYRVPGERFDKDWHLIDPAAPLLNPDINLPALQIWGDKAQTGDMRTLEADAVVRAVGASGNASYFDRSAGFASFSYGVTWYNRDTSMLKEGLRIHHMAPYKTIAAGCVGGVARLGSSSAATPEKATTAAVKMLETAVQIGITPSKEGWTPILGERMKLGDPRIPRMEKMQPWGFWEMRGYHRTGYALAPADAERLLGML